MKEWLSKWEANIKTFFNSGASEFWVFLNKKDWHVTVIKMPNDRNKCKYFNISVDGHGLFDFELYPHFMSHLFSQQDKPDPGKGRIRISFFNG